MNQVNNPSSNPNRTVADEAARWFLRLQENTASSDTFLEWQQWVNAAPEHRTTYEEIEDTVLRLGRVSVMPKLPSAEEMAQDRYDGSEPIAQWQERRSGVRRWQRYSIAAGLVLLVSGGAWLLDQHARFTQQGDYTYRTASGERQVVKLPDGSRVTLDADSSLDVQLSADRRSLTLERGEAYFEVSKDPQRPFVVRAGSTQVTAVGTAFNVRMSDDRTVVAVTEGKVEFVAMSPPATAHASSTRPKLTAQVSAGEGVSYMDDGNLQALPEHEAPLATTWLEGRRQYLNEPLRYVLADVDRYTGQKIELADEATGDLCFTGTLNFKNSAAWLHGLSVALPVVVTRQEDGTLLVGQK